MEKRTSILSKSIIAATVLAVSGFTANAAGLFTYNNLGTGESVRTNLLQREESAKNFDLTCGTKKTDSTMSKKGKDGKCGEGKCGEKKKKTGKKGKEGKCGEGKCGETKKNSKG